MYYLVIFEKGSNVHGVAKGLKAQGVATEVVSTPLKLSRGGCGYSIKLKKDEFDILNSVVIEYNVNIKEKYKVTQEKMSKSYEKV